MTKLEETQEQSCEVVHCKKEPYDVYIGRGSEWGNPFILGADGTRDQVIEFYRLWLLAQPDLLSKIHTLKGKRLGCFCKPKNCHGDVLKELAEDDTSGGFRGPYDFLSNMYEVDITYQGITFPSSEHLYFYQQIPEGWWRNRVLETPHGKVAKKIASNPKCPRISTTKAFKLQCMKRAVWEKFKVPAMQNRLIDTHPTILVEYNWWNDTFWGVCRGEGENHLGRLLMHTRKHYVER